MNIIVDESNAQAVLSILSDHGIDWTQDLIGNAGALTDGQFVWDDTADAYRCDQATYDWWARYILDAEATQSEALLLADELGIPYADVTDRIGECQDGDYEAHRRQAQRAIQEMRDERAAAATLGRRGGRSTSAAKATAARANGKRGGRPRKNGA